MRRLLIANRGEIALRVAQTARARGIETVLAASAADRDSLAAKVADRTVVIGSSPASASYLNAPLLIHTALATGCDAIHPGYGFLSERAVFAENVESAGLIFVGPTAATMHRIGDKLSARSVAHQAGVPMASGSSEVRSSEDAGEIADHIGYPVITKASAGGGGRGMTVARDRKELLARFESASREAKQAFGDGRLYLERFVERARHLEVQVFGDGKGQAVHFGERDCSIQRRYQKMVEESPAILLPTETRNKLHTAAINLLTTVNYRGAGTVEFLYDPDTDEFFFMEVNARLQVEHPVSEETNNINLVDLQLAIAGGEDYHWDQGRIEQHGHSIEVRILAEDPAQGFRPSPGRITSWQPPTGDGIRLDSGVTLGTFVPPYYDSMIGKLIATAADRATAIADLTHALDNFEVGGIQTNIPLLRNLVRDKDFLDNNTSTRWLDSAAEKLVRRETV